MPAPPISGRPASTEMSDRGASDAGGVWQRHRMFPRCAIRRSEVVVVEFVLAVFDVDNDVLTVVRGFESASQPRTHK